MSPAILAVFVVAFLASLLGPLCGIGGGVIIKPVVDAMNIMPVATVSFLSSVSVLTMSLATLAQNAAAKTSTVNVKSMLPLALGSAVGGVAGKFAFNYLGKSIFSDSELVGAVQAAILIALTACVFVYTLRKDRVRALDVQSGAAKAAIGFVAGALWSFLGIGGGPFNLAILTFFFAMETKPAAQASLFIIAFSQTASLIYSLVRGGLPEFAPVALLGMCVAAVAGSVIGRKIARRVSSQVIDRTYLFALVLIICVCCYNFARFTGLA
jgi:uncharacterized protein